MEVHLGDPGRPADGWHLKDADDVFTELAVDPGKGLSESEARTRLERFGPNRLAEKKRRSLFLLFLRQMNNLLVYILLTAAVISALLGELKDSLVIAAVVLLNAVVGVIQESRAEKSLDELKKLSSPGAIVKREGVLREIPSVSVVPGDVVVLEAGRIVPCDVRLTETSSFRVDESALTGESLPARKDAAWNRGVSPGGGAAYHEEEGFDGAPRDAEVPLGDRGNMAFMSTIAVHGRAAGVAVATGMSTQIGKIAGMLEGEQEERTPLQKKIDRFARVLGFVILALSAVMFGIGAARLYGLGGFGTHAAGTAAVNVSRPGVHGSVPQETLFQLFLTAVALAVAAIPEGLPAIITIVLALGVQRMIRRNAIVRRLPAVETLGSVSVICTDKTGTLTMNRMTVKRFCADGTCGPMEGMDMRNPVHAKLVQLLTLCNDAVYGSGSGGADAGRPRHGDAAHLPAQDTAYPRVGDALEVALLESASGFGVRKQELERRMPRIDEIPFDSVRKRMTTVHRDSESTLTVATKGAVEGLVDVCSRLSTSKGDVPFTPRLKSETLVAAADMSSEAYRVLGAAYKTVENGAYTRNHAEEDLVFVGFVGMIDPPRLEVKRSIERCGRAGVKTVMVTGDHRNTAFAIAKELGIASEAGEAVDGNELSSMSPESLRKRVDRLRVFARVSPDHKVRIVRALRETGGIVSMTGDGVNDAPSLRAADIGVAMGRGGTDVAKAAADMVLTDDNFETIVAAVEEGRNIFRNIKKTIVFLLSTNAGEFVSVFATVLAGFPLLLLPIHILWVNLVTDTLPALSLGVDPPDSDVLEEPPRAPNESLFAGGAGVSILLNGILIGFLTLAAFFIGFAAHDGSLLHARSMGFTVLSISQLFHAFNIRHARKSIVQVGLLSNRFLVGSFLLCLLLQILVVTLPAAAALFRVVTLTMRDWGVVAGLAILPVVLNEAVKLFFRMSRR